MYSLVNGLYDASDRLQSVYLFTLTIPFIIPILLADFILIVHILLIRFHVNEYEQHLCQQLPDLADYILGLAMAALLAKLVLLCKA